MLELKSTPYTYCTITQLNTDPSIYMDHWALREFSSDEALSKRFRDVLVRRDGMLEISWLNVLEFVKVSDMDQVRAVESFLDCLTHKHIGFIDVIPKKVIEKENQFLRHEENASDPHLDRDLLKTFFMLRKASLNPLSFKGLFSDGTSREKMKPLARDFLNQMTEVLEESRRKALDPKFGDIVKKIPQYHPEVQHLTRYIDLEIARLLIRERDMQLTQNDWFDHFHLVVPMAYCDFVFVDSRWAAIGNQVQNRLKKAGHKGDTALLFSKPAIDGFWRIFDV